MLKTLKALADPTRLRLVAILRHGEVTVQELTAILGMGQSRVSRHLKIMVDAGMVSVTRQGTWSYYRLETDHSFFRAILPALEYRMEALPEHRSDLEGLARIFENRRRKSREFFDQHARQWDALAAEILPLPVYRDVLFNEIPQCQVALEIGIGTGALLCALGRKIPRVIGVDHAQAMLEQAALRVRKEGLHNIDLRLGDMSHLPLADGEVQVAVADMVLHHAPQPMEALQELHRVLAPQGLLVVADMRHHGQEWTMEKLADQWFGFEQPEVERWLRETGFTAEKWLAWDGKEGGPGVFVVVARKEN
jgi:ubiquinone/menaquinone biosynthesis C-methylase UbiE/DNA-binding transcriptional ArsR family regulator